MRKPLTPQGYFVEHLWVFCKDTRTIIDKCSDRIEEAIFGKEIFGNEVKEKNDLSQNFSLW